MKTWIKAINSFAMLLAMLCFCPSCSSSDEIQEPSTEENPKEETKEEVKIKARADIELTEVETQLAHQSADFSIRLLQAAEKTEDNKKQIVLSPLSASYALSMVSNGAGGDTQQELLEALGFDGFSVEDGVTSAFVEEAHLTESMMNVAQQRILLADSSKIGKCGFGRICGIEDIDTLITDSGISTKIKEKIEALGVEVIIA